MGAYKELYGVGHSFSISDEGTGYLTEGDEWFGMGNTSLPF